MFGFCLQDGANKHCCDSCATETSQSQGLGSGEFVGFSGATCSTYEVENKDYCDDEDTSGYYNDKTACDVCPQCFNNERCNIPYAEGSYDTNDNIKSEWLGGVEFKHKKHLLGGFLLFWRINKSDKSVTFGLLGPKNNDEDEWIGLAFSDEKGNMAGADGVLATQSFNAMMDMFIATQSYGGIIKSSILTTKDKKVETSEGRTVIIFTRPFKPEGSHAVEDKTPLRPRELDILGKTTIIYSRGRSKSCEMGFCPHLTGEGYASKVTLSGSRGAFLYDVNKSVRYEPCQGRAALECAQGFYCTHDPPINGDRFAFSATRYGVCLDSAVLGGNSESDEYDGKAEQLVFKDNGGFDNKAVLAGGFVLLWTVNRVAPGRVGSEDFINMAVISTDPTKQGWIGIGFSPNGQMEGSDAVIGWNDGGGNFKIGDYFLRQSLPSQVSPGNKQNLIFKEVIRKNGQLALVFGRPLYTADSVPIDTGATNIILAAGVLPTKANLLTYHTFRTSTTVRLVGSPEELSNANKPGSFELCGGSIALSECKEGAGECQKLPPMNLEEGSVGLSSDPYSYKMAFASADGVCLREDQKGQLDGLYDLMMARLSKSSLVKPNDYQNELQLHQGITMYWTVYKDATGRGMIKMAYSNRLGNGWMGIGISRTGAMVGSNAMMGWVNGDRHSVGDVFLKSKFPWDQVLINKQEATDRKIEFFEGETLMSFTRPLYPSVYKNSVDLENAIIPGANFVIYAIGDLINENSRAYGKHRFRDVTRVVFYDKL